VLYDGNCQLCRRVIASIRVFDVFGRATYVNALNQAAIKDHRLDWLDSAALLQDMYVVVGGKSWAGFPAYRVLAARIVFLWPILPFLYLWPIPVMGRRIYRQVADSRICEIGHQPRHASAAGHRASARSAAVMAIGIILVVGNILAGVAQMETGWPFFVMYPTFSGIASPDTQSAEIVAIDSTGAMVPLTVGTASRILFSTNYWSQLSLILSTIDRQEGRDRLRAIGQVWKLNDSSVHNAVAIRLYRTTISTVPERAKDNPIHRELLCEVKL
jgi:predicted DCC family thiol-disulfide oxidoreductase YuxK